MSRQGAEDQPVNGLVDSRRAAHLLGVDVNTFKVWASRSRTAKSGIAAAMPTPVATMHGQVYQVEQIEEFGRHIALSARGPRTRERGLGAYYTPDDAALVMARWALRSGYDVVLEPSLGDGQFALAAAAVAQQRGWDTLNVHGCELNAEAAANAVKAGVVTRERLHVGDFLAATDLPRADVVIGNPPYVRVRDVSAELRRSALRANAVAMGEEMDSAGSVWMPFVARSTQCLAPGGRLAFVLPLDFTYVRYARSLWEFLGRSFGQLRVLRFQQRVFPDISQNVLILLADYRGGTTDTVNVVATERVADVDSPDLGSGVDIRLDEIIAGDRAFQRALLPTRASHVLEQLAEHIQPASDRMKFNIGYVAGNKHFFHPSPETVRAFKLPRASLIPTLASSRQLSRQGLRTSTMDVAAHLWLPGWKLTKSEEAYVAHGEAEEVDMAYKCRIRSPWYKVPGVKIPDLVLTTFSDPPRLHLNDGGWAASNSVLGGFMKTEERPEQLVSSWYTPLTALSAELQIHSLGGGVMIAVPREADAVHVLRADAAKNVDPHRLDAALSSGDRSAAYRVGDAAVEALVGREGLASLLEGVETLATWRKAAG